MEQDLVLDFTGVYASEKDHMPKTMKYVNVTDMKGTDMYCSKEAEEQIRKRLEAYGPSGIHFLDSGNYHYVTKFFVEKIKKPFSLVLFDYHDDMRQPMIHDLTSCGSWAREVLLENPYLRQLIIIGPDEKTLDGVDEKVSNKLISISIQELEAEKAKKKIARIDQSVPVYISIDKDVLSRSYAVTNWNQGKMSLDMLEDILSIILVVCDVIGVDICGEYSSAEGRLSDYLKAEATNQSTNRKLYEYIRSFLEK